MAEGQRRDDDFSGENKKRDAVGDVTDRTARVVAA